MPKQQTIVIDPKKILWTKIRTGYYRKDLCEDKRKKKFLSLLKITRHARLKKHSHPDTEWVYVLKGAYADEYSRVRAGMVKINFKDSQHMGKTNGCLLLVLWSGKHISVS